MTITPDRALIAAVLAIAAVIVKLWGSEIAGGTAGGWKHGRAQASAERRRASSVIRETRQRHGSGLSGAAAAVRGTAASARSAWAGMRGPRPGGAVPRAGAGTGPVGRVARAARAGAVTGARRAGRIARAAAARRPGGSAGPGPSRPGSPRPSWRGTGRPASPLRWAAGVVTRRPGGLRPVPGTPVTALPRARHRAAPVGACDGGCGRITPGLEPVPVDRPGGRQEWLLCWSCRQELAAPPSPVLQPAAVPGSLPDLQPLPELPGLQPFPVPGALPGTSYPHPELIPAGGIPVMSSGQPLEIPARRTGSPGMYGGGAIAAPRGTAVAVRDNTTHGQWVRNVQAILKALDALWRIQEQMLAGLTSANASRDQIRDVRAWSDRVTMAGKFILDGLADADRRLAPLIAEIGRQGGPAQVADPGYYADYR